MVNVTPQNELHSSLFFIDRGSYKAWDYLCDHIFNTEALACRRKRHQSRLSGVHKRILERLGECGHEDFLLGVVTERRP